MEIQSSTQSMILTSSQMAAADRFTIDKLKVTGESLMEKAGKAALEEILKRKPKLKKILVLCGKGNNGGDGFVVARLAQEMGIEVDAILYGQGSKVKGDALIALNKYESVILEPSTLDKILSSTECVVDALYGIKFRGSLEGVEAEAVEKVNALRSKSDLFVVSLDLPSGVICDTGAVNGPAFESDLTVTFQCWKPLHFNFPGAELSGERVVVDIGIRSEEIPEIQLITPELIKNFESLLVSSFGHKGVRGHLIVCAGSPGHSGAAALSSRAGLRAGAGLVTLVSDNETAKIAVEVTPEIMTCEASEGELEQLTKIKKGAVVVGPGLGKNSGAFEFILSSLNRLPLVVDASALQMLVADSKLKSKLLSHSILTPHPGEMAALLGTTNAEILNDRFGAVREAVKRFKCAVLLKGAYSIVGFSDGQVFVSPFANANLGTAGSGDVLSGLIGGLLSRGLTIKTASLLAVYLHGKIGSSLLAEGVVGSLASEFADKFPIALSDFINEEETSNFSRFPKIL